MQPILDHPAPSAAVRRRIDILRERRQQRYDAALAVAGVLLFLALAGWITQAGRVSGTGGLPDAGLILLTLAVYAFARIASAENGWELPLGIAAGGVAVAFMGGESLLSNIDSPIGYANATAAFFVLATAAALMAVERCHLRAVRVAAGAAAAAFAIVPIGNGSKAGAALLLLLPLGFFARGRRDIARRLVLLGMATVLLVIGLSAWLGVNYDPDTGETQATTAVAALSSRRVVLWHEAVDMMRADPLYGVGPGEFATNSATALRDEDAAWAHSAYLQVGAETGVPGLVLVIALVLWAFLRLLRSELDVGAAIAAMALAAAALHAGIDYVWDFPVVPLTTALLVGIGCGRGTEAR
jgi:O-antigen ligase